jgi:hypothetical protein
MTKSNFSIHFGLMRQCRRINPVREVAAAILLAPMDIVADGKLAAAVSRAGSFH